MHVLVASFNAGRYGWCLVTIFQIHESIEIFRKEAYLERTRPPNSIRHTLFESTPICFNLSVVKNFFYFRKLSKTMPSTCDVIDSKTFKECYRLEMNPMTSYAKPGAGISQKLYESWKMSEQISGLREFLTKHSFHKELKASGFHNKASRWSITKPLCNLMNFDWSQRRRKLLILFRMTERHNLWNWKASMAAFLLNLWRKLQSSSSWLQSAGKRGNFCDSVALFITNHLF